MSAIFYRGPSLIDGEPILGVITYGSRNGKTGNMAQTWILLADVPPHIAVKDGRDVSVCGTCSLRPSLHSPESERETCYVRTHEAPLSTWRKAQRGGHPVVHAGGRAALGRGWNVRLGAYGNPSAIPVQVWRELLSEADGWTGYDHLWNSSDPVVRMNARALRQYCMASAETPEQVAMARDLGWRTFRVRRESDPLLPRERVCPASKEAGKVSTCEICRACSGLQGRGAQSIAIIQH